MTVGPDINIPVISCVQVPKEIDKMKVILNLMYYQVLCCVASISGFVIKKMN